MADVDNAEERRLRALAMNKKRHRVSVFCSEDGLMIRLRFKQHLQIYKTKSTHCALCGPFSGRRRSNFMCYICKIHLCVRIHKNNRKKCWTKWQETKHLEMLPTIHYISAVHCKKKRSLPKSSSSTARLITWGNKNQTSLLVKTSTHKTVGAR